MVQLPVEMTRDTKYLYPAAIGTFRTTFHCSPLDLLAYAKTKKNVRFSSLTLHLPALTFCCKCTSRKKAQRLRSPPNQRPLPRAASTMQRLQKPPQRTKKLRKAAESPMHQQQVPLLTLAKARRRSAFQSNPVVQLLACVSTVSGNYQEYPVFTRVLRGRAHECM